MVIGILSNLDLLNKFITKDKKRVLSKLIEIMNYVRLADLDELALTVRDKDSGLYIGEAISAYRGGAYRAAIMSTWIAVVTDTISKIRELATQGDAGAASIITNLDNAISSNNIQQLQKIENELLDKARNDFEFLSQQEYTDLDRLKVDRNFCAHPAFVAEGVLFQPQPDLVRSHIVHAITHLLQHQPVQGKSALARIQAEILRPSFPSDVENVKKLLGAKYLTRAKESLVKNLIAALLSGYLKEDPALFGKEDALINSLIAVSLIHPTIYEETLRGRLIGLVDALNDKQLARIFRLIGVDTRFWSLLDEPAQIRVKGVLNALDTRSLIEHHVFDLINTAEFNTFVINKFNNLKDLEKEEVIAANPHPDFADLTISLYAGAVGFRAAERLGQGVLLPMSSHFTKEHILKVLESAAVNRSIRVAGLSPDILADFFDETLLHINETKEGWKGFLDALSDDPSDRFSYPKLRGKMVAQGILATLYPEVEEGSGDDQPF